MIDEAARRHERLAGDGPIEDAEAAARRVGLSLERLEILRRSPDLAETVLEAVRSGATHEDLEAIDWEGVAREAFGREQPRDGVASEEPGSAASA